MSISEFFKANFDKTVEYECKIGRNTNANLDVFDDVVKIKINSTQVICRIVGI